MSEAAQCALDIQSALGDARDDLDGMEPLRFRIGINLGEIVIDGELVTPGASAGNLRGITKKAAREACERHGLALVERNVHARDLPRATECFVTSATREVMPIVSLRLDDGTVVDFPPGGGEVTRKVAEYYKQYLDEHVRENASLSLW